MKNDRTTESTLFYPHEYPIAMNVGNNSLFDILRTYNLNILHIFEKYTNIFVWIVFEELYI